MVLKRKSMRIKRKKLPGFDFKTGMPLKKRLKRPRTVSISKLMQRADKLFSLNVRQSGANKEGLVQCYTCGNWNHWKKMQNGHYLSRYYKAARWHEDNCRVQCMMCNLWKRGDPIKFRQKLVAEIGLARVLNVEKLRYAPVKLSREFLQEKLQQLSHPKE